MKTLQEIEDRGFKLMRTLGGVQTYAKWLDNEDKVVHYVQHAFANGDRPEFVGEVQTMTLADVMLGVNIFEKLIMPNSWDRPY